MKRILVPVDPTCQLDAAGNYAAQLARMYDAELIAMYILDDSRMQGAHEGAQSLDDAMAWIAQDVMEQYAHRHGDLKVQKLMGTGRTATAVFQAVLRTGAESVVLGGFTKGPNSFWGSVSMDIVDHCERPAFVVRKPAGIPKEGDRVMIAYDGSQRATECLQNIARFLKVTKAVGYLCYAAAPKDMDRVQRELDEAKLYLQTEGVMAETAILERSRFHSHGWVLDRHARQVDAKLIALSRLGRSSIHTGRSRTVAWLVSHAHTPVWVVRR